MRAGRRQSLNQWGQAAGNLWTNEGRPPAIFEPMRASRRQSLNQWEQAAGNLLTNEVTTEPPPLCAGVPGQEMLGSRGRPAQADGGAPGLGGRRPRPLLQEQDAEGGPRARGHPRRLPTHLRQVQHLVSISGAAYCTIVTTTKTRWLEESRQAAWVHILPTVKVRDSQYFFLSLIPISAGGPEKGCFWQKGILRLK
jgi:hypothetical protein